MANVAKTVFIPTADLTELRDEHLATLETFILMESNSQTARPPYVPLHDPEGKLSVGNSACGHG